MVSKPAPGQLVECRGGVWRFVKAERDFWQLELLRQGANYAEEVVQVCGQFRNLSQVPCVCCHRMREQFQLCIKQKCSGGNFISRF